MVQTDKPFSFVENVSDCQENLGQFDPSFDSSGAFKEFWKEYKEKLGLMGIDIHSVLN